MNTADIGSKIKSYILAEFLPGEDPDNLQPTTPLVTSGVLDSISTLKLVSFLEESFAVSLEAHEVDAEHMDTLQQIEQLVVGKMRSAR